MTKIFDRTISYTCSIADDGTWKIRPIITGKPSTVEIIGAFKLMAESIQDILNAMVKGQKIVAKPGFMEYKEPCPAGGYTSDPTKVDDE
jgi:hypothetical protein